MTGCPLQLISSVIWPFCNELCSWSTGDFFFIFQVGSHPKLKTVFFLAAFIMMSLLTTTSPTKHFNILCGFQNFVLFSDKLGPKKVLCNQDMFSEASVHTTSCRLSTRFSLGHIQRVTSFAALQHQENISICPYSACNHMLFQQSILQMCSPFNTKGKWLSNNRSALWTTTSFHNTRNSCL